MDAEQSNNFDNLYKIGRGICPDCLWEPNTGCNTDRGSETCIINKKLILAGEDEVKESQ